MDPHRNTPTLTSGPALGDADAAVVLVHGRGGTADGILALADALAVDRIAYFAPQAAGNTWYPQSFLAPIPANEPGLSSGLAKLDRLVTEITSAGLSPERLVLLGFSQGACLTLEYAARHPRRFGGVVGFSGGLIGPPGTPRDYPGTLSSTPFFLGCSDIDPHIPVGRVRESADILGRMGAQVDTRIYRGMGHEVNDDELAAARAIVVSAGAATG